MRLGFLAVLALAFCGSVFAAEEFDDISHKELSDAVKAKKVTLLDCNNTLTYKKNHIPGALDYGKSKTNLEKLLPADKSALIVAYCGDPSCTAYKAGAQAAKDMGYTNVKRYSLGIVGWIAAKEQVESADPATPAEKKEPAK